MLSERSEGATNIAEVRLIEDGRAAVARRAANLLVDQVGPPAVGDGKAERASAQEFTTGS